MIDTLSTALSAAKAKQMKGRHNFKSEQWIEACRFSPDNTKVAYGHHGYETVVEVVKIDGALASVWTPYKFYFNGKFSHCGVNSFQLVRMNNTWKVQYIIDTRRRVGCE